MVKQGSKEKGRSKHGKGVPRLREDDSCCFMRKRTPVPIEKKGGAFLSLKKEKDLLAMAKGRKLETKDQPREESASG